MKTQLIITHPGSAHFDEVTAISFLLAEKTDVQFRIERREPMPVELDDPDIWVIDIGLRHEPEKHNFDHHQSLDCPASFVLVAGYLGLLETMSVMPWWQFKDSVDRIGPVESSVIFHAGDDLVNRNPVESWLVTRFAGEPEQCIPMLKDYGKKLIKEAKLLKKQIDYWKTAKRLVIAGVPAVLGETKESAGLDEFHRLEKNPPDIVISLDRTGSGWRLFRFVGAPVNFALIADSPEIAFAHKNGFMAKTKERLPLEALISLVSKAVTVH
jgi:Uncharacterised protein family (UPF0160)